MDPQDVATFFGLLLIGGAIGIGLLATQARTRATLVDAALPLAAALAVGATLGSLYFSERAGFIPCELCWFQRVAMYPMAVVLTIASFRRDATVLVYALTLASMGLAVSGYHIQLQLFPDQSTFCAPDNPCTSRWVEAFGWLTIPQMAAITFALIAVLAGLSLSRPRHQPIPEESP